MKVHRMEYFDVFFPYQDRLVNAYGTMTEGSDILHVREIYFGESEYVVWSILERGAPPPDVVEFEEGLRAALITALTNSEVLR